MMEEEPTILSSEYAREELEKFGKINPKSYGDISLVNSQKMPIELFIEQLNSSTKILNSESVDLTYQIDSIEGQKQDYKTKNSGKEESEEYKRKIEEFERTLSDLRTSKVNKDSLFTDYNMYKRQLNELLENLKSRAGELEKKKISGSLKISKTKPMEIEKATIHPLFYPVTSYTELKPEDEGLKDFIQRESGIQKNINRTNLIITASRSLTDYNNKRKEALEDVANAMAYLFQTEFNRLIKLGYNESSAKKKAEIKVQSEKSRMVADVNKKYPLNPLELLNYKDKSSQN